MERGKGRFTSELSHSLPNRRTFLGKRKSFVLGRKEENLFPWRSTWKQGTSERCPFSFEEQPILTLKFLTT